MIGACAHSAVTRHVREHVKDSLPPYISPPRAHLAAVVPPLRLEVPLERLYQQRRRLGHLEAHLRVVVDLARLLGQQLDLEAVVVFAFLGGRANPGLGSTLGCRDDLKLLFNWLSSRSLRQGANQGCGVENTPV